MTTFAVKNNFLPPGVVSNLQEVFLNRKGGAQNDKDQQSKPKDDDPSTQPSSSDSVPHAAAAADTDNTQPVVLVTNADGIESPGLTCVVDAIVREGLCNVNVYAPQSDKSVAGHSFTLKETMTVTPSDILVLLLMKYLGLP